MWAWIRMSPPVLAGVNPECTSRSVDAGGYSVILPPTIPFRRGVAGWAQFMFVWWNWLLEKDVGALAVAALLVALAAAVMKMLRDRAEIRKLGAEARKIDADASATLRRDRSPHREGVRTCAGGILRTVSALVDELYATFNPFAFPPAKINRARLQEAVLLARRFRHEQRYRVEMEALLAEPAAYAPTGCDAAVSQIGSQARGLLAKVSDKRAVVAGIEQDGLNHDNAAAARSRVGGGPGPPTRL